jgi:hypothetical protein
VIVLQFPSENENVTMIVVKTAIEVGTVSETGDVIEIVGIEIAGIVTAIGIGIGIGIGIANETGVVIETGLSLIVLVRACRNRNLRAPLPLRLHRQHLRQHPRQQ